MDTWYTLQLLSFLVDSFWKTRTTKGNQLPMERAASFTARAKRLHVDHITGRRVWCLVRVFLKQSDATTFAQHCSCLGPRICCPNSNQAFPATTRHQNRICGTELEDYLYPYLKRLSLPLCFQGTTVRDDCLRVRGCFGGWCRLAAVAWFSRWHTGASLAAVQLPQDMCTCRMDCKLDQNTASTRFSFCLTVKVIWRQCPNQLLVQRRSFREKPRLLWVF